MKGARLASRKTRNDIWHQWDAVAAARDRDIANGIDLSYRYVLSPWILRRIPKSAKTILDTGCGSGHLSSLLAGPGREVLGIDASSISVDLAVERYRDVAGLSFICARIEEIAKEKRRYDVVVANMVLQTTPSLRSTCRALAKLLKENGTLLVTITHPCYWPRYWGYEKQRWFFYDKEIAIEAPFRISMNPRSVGITTHFHRPLSGYFSAFQEAGLAIHEFGEPMPSLAIAKRYPKPWIFPRFAAFRVLSTLY